MNFLSFLVVLAGTLPQQRAEDGRGQSLFTKEWHAARRAVLMERFEERDPGVIVLRGAATQNDYREFRQDNEFWYFTGVTTPNAVLVLVPKTGDEYLFTPEVNPQEEVWVGDRVDPGEAQEITGIANCLPLGAGERGAAGWGGLDQLLGQLAKKYPTFWTQEQPAENWMMSRDQLQVAARDQRRDPFDGRLTREGQFVEQLKARYKVKVKDITVLLDALRVVKTPEEIEAMRRACEISGQAHLAAMKSAAPGTYEWQLAAEMTSAMLRAGARGPAYMAIVGSGPNACILHYSENTRALQAGDVVMIDYGAEFNNFVADISRSWPVNGQFTPRQREVYEAVYAAQEAAFQECKPGSSLERVRAASDGELRRRGFKDIWHGPSHWLGMATHDVGNYETKLEPGMAFTVEPGVYLPEEGIGVRIEDVVVITESGYDLLSKMIPRRIDAIEALRRQAP